MPYVAQSIFNNDDLSLMIKIFSYIFYGNIIHIEPEMELYVNVQHTNNNPNMITKNQMYYNNIMHETLDNDKQLIHIEWHSPV